MVAYVHIGTPKTGTTSIQHFLYANKDLLLEEKILYPSSIILNEQYDPQHWNLATLLNNFCKDDVLQNALVAALYNEIKNTNPKSVVFSSEAFQSVVKYENIKYLKYLLLKLGFKKIIIILYIRDAVDVWMSLCSEFLKNGVDDNLAHKKIHENSLLQQILDYKNTLLHWSNIFGKDNIILRQFDKECLYDSDLIKDFAYVSKIKWNDGFAIPKKQNESLNLIGMEILKHLNKKPLISNGVLYHDLIPFFNKYFTKKEKELLFYPPKDVYLYYEKYSHMQFKWINKYFQDSLYFEYKPNNNYHENYKLENIKKEYFVEIADFIADLFSSKNEIILQKQNQIDKQNEIILQKQNQIDKQNEIILQKQNQIDKQNEIILQKQNQIDKQNEIILQKQNQIDRLKFQVKYGTAKARIQNQLSYKLGQAMIVNSKSFLGYIRMPFVLSYIKDKHKQEQKIYQEKIKKDPSLALPSLESYSDYQEALRFKNHLSYKLGQALIQANKTWWWGVRYIKLWFKIKSIKKQKKEDNDNRI